MLQIENTFFELGEICERDCLIICDRGAMDAAACNIIIIYLLWIYTDKINVSTIYYKNLFLIYSRGYDFIILKSRQFNFKH